MNKDPEHPSRIVDRYLSRYRTESSLGQNFLIEPFPIQASIQASRDLGLDVNSHVLEIGPGPGALTRSIFIQGANSIIAIEKDYKSIKCLQSLQDICGCLLYTSDAADE